MGRKLKDDPKKTVQVGIENSVIEKLGGLNSTKEFLYKSAHEGAEKIKEDELQQKK